MSSGFQTTANMQAAGTKQVTVTYKGLTTSYSITVKKPSVKLQKEQIEGRHPPVCDDGSCRADSPVDLAESADRLFRGQRAPCSRCGTATIKASMVYNGVTYSDTTTITVLAEEKENYSFEIRRTETSTNGQFYKYFVNTNIPNFDSSKVTWWLEPGRRTLVYRGRLRVSLVWDHRHAYRDIRPQRKNLYGQLLSGGCRRELHSRPLPCGADGGPRGLRDQDGYPRLYGRHGNMDGRVCAQRRLGRRKSIYCR